jgi:chromosome segregation ATPase
MPGLRAKLRVLMQANLRGERGEAAPSIRRAGADVAALRQQIARALDDEDRLQQTIQAAAAQIAALDQQADEALSRGDEATARHLVGQLQRRRQQLAFLEADLAQHRYVTADLMRRVNTLEALVAQAQQSVAQGEALDEDTVPLAERIRQARAEIARRVETLRTSETAPADDALDEQAIEDDLARRRARLSQ